MRTATLIVFMVIGASHAVAQQTFCTSEVEGQLYCDDFEDGNASFPPVEWTPRLSLPGSYEVRDGSYVLTPTSASGDELTSEALDILVTDVSLRTRARFTGTEGAVFLAARNQNHEGIPRNYFGAVGYYPQSGGSVLLLGRSNAAGDITFFGGFPLLPFDARSTDVMLRFDVIGNELKLWGWKAGEPMPERPQLIARDTTYASGTTRIGGRTGIGRSSVTSFRYVQAIVPEPPSLTMFVLGYMLSLAVIRT